MIRKVCLNSIHQKSPDNPKNLVERTYDEPRSLQCTDFSSTEQQGKRETILEKQMKKRPTPTATSGRLQEPLRNSSTDRICRGQTNSVESQTNNINPSLSFVEYNSSIPPFLLSNIIPVAIAIPPLLFNSQK